MLAYAPMFNGRAERMVGTLKKSIVRLVVAGNDNWESQVSKAV